MEYPLTDDWFVLRDLTRPNAKRPAYRLLEEKALEPMLSRNIIKLQITDNHILSKAQSKSKSF